MTRGINNYILYLNMDNNTFYVSACMDYSTPVEIDSKNSPIAGNIEFADVDDGLRFHRTQNGSMYAPRSIMNDNVAINYRNIFNSYPVPDNKKDFTEFSDYLRCMSSDAKYREYLNDRKNPTYQNILKYYNDDSFDPHGMSRYKIQDFIYCKYYNQIPNNYMITLRRYTRPCEDHVFGLDMPASALNDLNGYPEDYFAIATAVTYMGEQAGNKLSDIMKFDYGAKWEEKTAEVQSLQASDGGLAAQMKEKLNIQEGSMSGNGGLNTRSLSQSFIAGALARARGSSGTDMVASQHAYPSNEFSARYGDEFFGDINVVDSTKLRSRGLTFSNNFTLTFEYSLKSLKCINPKIAMMDILSNFLILTGNYGTFWGGATMFFGTANIAPQFGDPDKLRRGDWKGYAKSLYDDVKTSFQSLSGDEEGSFTLENIINAGKNLISSGIDAFMNNIFGSVFGVAGQSQIPKAMLTGAPTGFWHLTIGNPLDPIATMGNMAVTKTSVQFNDVLGYDDFPTEIKFTVEMEHCRPRDNAGIESIFNAGKGRFYAFTNLNLELDYHNVNTLASFSTDMGGTQEVTHQGTTTGTIAPALGNNRLKIIGATLNN